MVSLAIGENCLTDTTADSFRDNALWFPDIPKKHLILNEDCYAGNRSPLLEFWPLCYVIFRDPTNPRPLTKISVVFQMDYIAKIEFHYSTGDVLGIGHLDVRCSITDHEFQTKSFDIDGAAGEVIKEIRLGCYKDEDGGYSERGMLCSFKVGAHFLGQQTPLIYAAHTFISCQN